MHKVALNKPPFALKVANFFGTFGYLSLLFEWFWIFGLLLYPHLNDIDFILPKSTPQTQPTPMFTIDSTFALVSGTVAAVFCLALVGYALYAVPRSIAKTGTYATRVAASAIIPAITHHKRVSKKESKRLTFTVICTIKVASIALPLLAVALLPDYPALSKQIISIVAAFFAAWATANFGIQLAIAKVAALDTTKIW